MKLRETPAYLLPRFSVTRPVTVVMILCAILVVGFIAYTRIPLSLMPEGLEGSRISIWTNYPNASPRDVEEKITRKIEDAVGTVPDVKNVRSNSSNGSSNVRVEFVNGADMKAAFATLRDRMDRVMPELPEEVDEIRLRRWDQGDQAIIFLAATLSPGMQDTYYNIETYVQPALQRIQGVANVEIWGVNRREVQISLNEERLRSHRIDPARIAGILRGQNLTFSSGYVRDGGRKVYVRSVGRFTSPGEIAEAIIDPGHNLRLRDIADVSLQSSRREWTYRVDRKPAIGLEIMRESTGNIEKISRDVRATLEELRGMPQLRGITFNVFSDQGERVRGSIENLRDSGLWGALFAAVILYSFLRAPRLTGILTLSIPLSLLCTIIVLFFTGWSLNIATMMGLLISIGMVIDNAIVIVENIYRRRQEGMEATPAAITGAGEVGLAVVMATLTSVVVFLPLILMSGEAEFSFWMLRIGLPVISSLLASLFIALVFVPLAAQRLSRGHRHSELRPVSWLRERYQRGLRWVLTHRLDAALIVLLAMSTIVFPLKRVPRSLEGGYVESNLWFFFDLPSGFGLEEAEAFFVRAEDLLLANAERYQIDRVETRFRNNNGRIQARFIPDPNSQWYEFAWDAMLKRAGLREPRMDRAAIEADFRRLFPLPPGVKMRTTWRDSGVQSDSVLSLNLYGEDTGMLINLSEEVVRRLRTIPGLLSVDTDLERGADELRVQLDRDRTRYLGVNPQSVSGGISSSLRGNEVGWHYAADGRELRIRLQRADAEEQRLDDLRNMTFRTGDGIEVPLESLADISVTRTLGQIRREDRKTMLSVTARAPRGTSAKLFAQVDQAMSGFEMPRGYRWDKGARYAQLEESNRAQRFALVLAVTFVFLLMGLLFESFVLPLAVIIAVPFSFLGVYWTLYITGTSMNFMAMVGAVILVGVVVNNAILLVDLTNRLRAEGRSRFDALIGAGRHRFRPILMTTFTTVFGLLPMAAGDAGMEGVPYAPLGRTMIGGLLMSAILTLMVVPLFYTFLDDLREYAAGIGRLIFARRGDSATAVEGADSAPIGK